MKEIEEYNESMWKRWKIWLTKKKMKLTETMAPNPKTLMTILVAIVFALVCEKPPFFINIISNWCNKFSPWLRANWPYFVKNVVIVEESLVYVSLLNWKNFSVLDSMYDFVDNVDEVDTPDILSFILF